MKKFELKKPVEEKRYPENVNILLVDDMDSNLQALEETLSVLGENLVSVSSGKDALKALIEDEFAVILLDINMPEMDGYETATLIRERAKTRTLPIMFVTAYDKGEPFVLEGYSKGAVDYILKPFNPEILKSKVSVYVDLFRAKEELRLKKEQENTANKQFFDKQQQQTNAELSESKEKLLREEKLSAMGKLASLVGHEMRGPLGVIKNSASFLNMRLIKNPDEKVTKHLRIIDEEIDRSEVIINNILGFARSKEVNPTFRRVNNLIKVLIKEEEPPKNIEVKTQLDQEIPDIAFDAELIKRVFHNLIRNAFQAMPGGGVLTISTALDEPRQQVKVLFADTGCGIAKEHLHKVFEALFTTKHNGTGLGLSACENIIHAHQGTIHVESEKDQGATFIITLPINTNGELT